MRPARRHASGSPLHQPEGLVGLRARALAPASRHPLRSISVSLMRGFSLLGGRSTRSPADCTEATPRVARPCLLIYGKVAADLVRKPRATGTGEEDLPNSRCAACGGAGPVDFAGKRARFVVSLRGQFTVPTDGGCGEKENAEASSLRGRSRQLDERLTPATGADPTHFVLFKSMRR